MNNYNAAVSPVIATILLVGVAIGASALAYSWYVGIQATSQEKGGTQAAEVTRGSATSAEVIHVSRFNSAQINVTVKNTGGIDLTNVNVTAWKGSSYVSSNTAAINSGSTNTTTLSAAVSSTSIIKVYSSDGKFLTSYPFIE